MITDSLLPLDDEPFKRKYLKNKKKAPQAPFFLMLFQGI